MNDLHPVVRERLVREYKVLLHELVGAQDRLSSYAELMGREKVLINRLSFEAGAFEQTLGIESERNKEQQEEEE